jgi:hypothetical protein
LRVLAAHHRLDVGGDALHQLPCIIRVHVAFIVVRFSAARRLILHGGTGCIYILSRIS